MMKIQTFVLTVVLIRFESTLFAAAFVQMIFVLQLWTNKVLKINKLDLFCKNIFIHLQPVKKRD